MIEEKTLGAEDTNVNELRKLRDELLGQRDNLKGQLARAKEEEAIEKKLLERKSMLKVLAILYTFINLKK